MKGTQPLLLLRCQNRQLLIGVVAHLISLYQFPKEFRDNHSTGYSPMVRGQQSDKKIFTLAIGQVVHPTFGQSDFRGHLQFHGLSSVWTYATPYRFGWFRTVRGCQTLLSLDLTHVLEDYSVSFEKINASKDVITRHTPNYAPNLLNSASKREQV